MAEIKQNEFDGRQQVCDVHFVDYGDNEYVGRDELFGLRTDMLQLRFQAVECFLAGVKPAAQHGERWDPRGIERFEELTQVMLCYIFVIVILNMWMLSLMHTFEILFVLIIVVFCHASFSQHFVI